MCSIFQVTCGSVVKLKHASSGYDLHSHEISYGSGSGQQSVTGYQDTSDAASLWAVVGEKVGLHDQASMSPCMIAGAGVMYELLHTYNLEP